MWNTQADVEDLDTDVTTTPPTPVAIRIIIAIALAASMLVAGTNLGILQQQSHAASQSKQQEQKITQDISGNIDKRSATRQQHMDQENLCIRTSDCKNSNVGEQTLGDDNSNWIC
jgi:Na+-transporting NADH:ubiquinone oxidoreductase subunit NqrC